MAPKISIIIPIYNASLFIEKTVDSILNQSFSDFEIILVDDGSKDNSYEICSKIQQTYNNIYLFHQNNQGAVKAREKGINESSGKFILFCDADDILPQDALQTLYNHSKDVDAVIAYDDDPATIPNKEPEVISGEELIKRFLLKKANPDIAAKLWKRSLFDKDIMDIPTSIVIGEDLIMNLRLAMRSSSVRIIYKCTYIYMQHEMQTTRKFAYSLEYEKNLYSNIELTLKNDKTKYQKYLCIYKIKRFIFLLRFGYNYNMNDAFVKRACRQALRFILPVDCYSYILLHRYPQLNRYILIKIASFKRIVLGIYH